jgi:hypothetical protein
MTESREEEKTVGIQKANTAPHAALNETATPSVTTAAATATAVGNLEEPPSRERPTDKRVVQRHANAMKARAGHRRNIRRSNTNG